MLICSGSNTYSSNRQAITIGLRIASVFLQVGPHDIYKLTDDDEIVLIGRFDVSVTFSETACRTTPTPSSKAWKGRPSASGISWPASRSESGAGNHRDLRHDH